MISRNILQKISLSSGRRWLYSCTAHSSAPSPSPVVLEKNPSFLGFSPQSIVSRFTYSSSFSFAHGHIDMRIPCTMKRCCFSSQAVIDLPVDGIVDVPLAQTGEGIAECELLRWFVQEGDQIEEFQPICEVQSDKATMEITSRYKGKVAHIFYVPGEIVKVGETLLKMVVEESVVPTLTSDGLENKILPGFEKCDPSSQSSALNKNNIGGVLATPSVRNLANRYGVNINDVHGTGEDGRVLESDVITYGLHQLNAKIPKKLEKRIVEEPSSSSSADSVEQFLVGDDKYTYVSAADGRQYSDKIVPLRGFQRTMVKTMTLAAKIPHFHYVEEINCDALVELKAVFQNENSDPDVKYTFLPLLIKSLSMALSRYPLLNSCFNEESQEIILKGSHNIGIAMATSHGLVVPNIKKVQSLSILEITKELSRLQQLALNNKLSAEDISGGTITLSNIGAIGGKFGSPLLNLPEVSIIAIGRIQKVPHFADDGNVYPVSVMSVNLGADHRVLDGATVARFCNEWKLYIEKPELLLLHMK